MRILFIISSFLVYFFTSGKDLTFNGFLEGDHALETLIENKNDNNEVYFENDSDDSEVDDTEFYSNQNEEDVDIDQSDNNDYEPDDNPVTWDEDPDNYPLETPDTYDNVDDEEVQSPTHYNDIPEGACAVCRDGSYSFSKNRRGTCSRHGGVAQWLK